jgi:hypothetical protein
MTNRVLAVLRDERFSPNSVDNDRAIMAAVVERLCRHGMTVDAIGEQHLAGVTEGYGLVLCMGRQPETLDRLKAWGGRCINTPSGIERCRRSVVEEIMREAGVPVPPAEGSHGYWLKRGDGAAQTHDDVVFAADKEELARRVAEFRQRGITDFTVSAHVVGDIVKFYGVLAGEGSGFFRYFYPTDDGRTKFGDETRNGHARHYGFNAMLLQQTMERLAAAVGISVYGGDVIVREDGTFCVIDFNDWPSFSRCRDEAAAAIARLVKS